MYPCAAITLSPCGSDHTAEVVRGTTSNAFTCGGLGSGQQVEWRLLYQSNNFSAGSCPPLSTGPCSQGELGVAFTPSRPSDSQSVLTVDSTLVNNDVILTSGTLQCDESGTAVRCQLDYIGEYDFLKISILRLLRVTYYFPQDSDSVIYNFSII